MNSNDRISTRMMPKVRFPPGTDILRNDGSSRGDQLNSPSILVVKHRNRRVAIPRTTNYDDIIASLQEAFPDLAATPPLSFAITSPLPGYGDAPIGVGRRVWNEVLADIKTVQILVHKQDGGTAEDVAVTAKKRKLVAYRSRSAVPAAEGLSPETIQLD